MSVGMMNRFFFFLLTIISTYLMAPMLLQAETVHWMSLRGHLSEERTKAAQKELEALDADTEQLVLELSSTSGSLIHTLDLAKALYGIKRERQLQVLVYINEGAVGPAAILPFLADTLMSSAFVSWGDIPLSTEGKIPTNLLRSQVRSLILPSHPQASTLSLLAQAMSDPGLQVIDDGGWKLVNREEKRGVSISRSGETLVVDHNQLRELGLLQETLELSELKERYGRVVQDLTDSSLTSLEEVANSFDQRLIKSIQFNPNGPNTVGHISIDDRTRGISQATWVYVRSALEYYKKTKPAFIILELNTPGGEVYSSQLISDALKEMDTNYGIPVVAFIDNWAISAGAMLAYSCRFITIVKDASMGAAEPVFAQGGEMQSAPEKINSALRTDFANRAGFYDRNPDIAEAMVDKDIILVKRHGKIIKLESEDQIVRTGLTPDELILASGKLLTLNAEQMLEFGVVDTLLPPAKVEPLTAEETESGKWPARKELLFQYPFFQQMKGTTIDSHQMSWQTHFFAFLATPAVASFLFLGMMLGFYMELNTPGFGIAGSVALACLFLITLSSFSVQAANVLEVIILCVGLVLIGVELFVLPGFGVVGALGLLLFIGGLFAMMLPALDTVSFDADSETWNAAGEEFMRRLAWLCGTTVVGVTTIALLARYVMPRVAFFNRLVLQGVQETDAGYYAGTAPEKLPAVGSQATVFATLRPAGKVTVADEVYDAVSDGVFIERGEEVVVREVRGSRLVVEPLEAQDEESDTKGR